ncbi:MAG: hypothetical protein ABDH18_05140 [Aquificaceae bacterium]
MKKLFALALAIALLLILSPPKHVNSQALPRMNDYCYVPPYVGSAIPPIVMLVMGRDHKLHYEAYNESSDVNEDGKIEITYDHSIDYYGYFDPCKCYVYNQGQERFNPVRKVDNCTDNTRNNFRRCGGSNEWSGNFLNWLSMSRADIMRKVLYGGFRRIDRVDLTVLEATFTPQDAHSWGKQVTGSLTYRDSNGANKTVSIRDLTPFNPPSSGNRHLFCMTSISLSQDAPRLIRVLENRSEDIEVWASKEGTVCQNQFANGVNISPTNYIVRVRVCDPQFPELNCKRYPGSDPVNTNDDSLKPIGLLQRYGEGDGTRWCSRSLRPCTNDAQCAPNGGSCIPRAPMYFGLLTGSYTNNTQGGVLRKNISSITNEINPSTGQYKQGQGNATDPHITQGIIYTLDTIKIVGYQWGSYKPGWDGAWKTSGPMNNGEFPDWGNPVGEMMYEAIRYLAGKTSPTSDFNYTTADDGDPNKRQFPMPLPRASWSPPYNTFPICSRPFMIVISDINNSYDFDLISRGTDLSSFNLSNLMSTISTAENISGSYFIGHNGSSTDFLCSAKSVSSLGSIRGLCPEEPTKQGSYTPAGVAYYGKVGFRDNFGAQKPPAIETFSIALASPLPDLNFKIGSRSVRINPIAVSPSGCLSLYQNCFQRCSVSWNSTLNRLEISNCSSNAFCPTNQIVDYYVNQVEYNPDGSLRRIVFKINYEDVEQAADHDLDAIAVYEISADSANNTIRIKIDSTRASGCIDQVMGFTISGTTEDGVWLVVRDTDSSTDSDTPAAVGNMPLSWSRTFTLSSNAAASHLKPPLWYAAKWGGFDDANNNNRPDLQGEWDKDNDGNPDNYFFVSNPAKLESQLEEALFSILKRASSGSTVATLSSRYQTSAIMLQPSFYPEYTTREGKSLIWLGTFRAYWVDNRQNFREDRTNNTTVRQPDFKMTIERPDPSALLDRVFSFFFTQDREVRVALFSDFEQCSVEEIEVPTNVVPALRFDCKLASYNEWTDFNNGSGSFLRKILYHKDGSSVNEGLEDFHINNANRIKDFWTLIDPTTFNAVASWLPGTRHLNAECVIAYIRGEPDFTWRCNDYVMRKRVLDLSQICPGYPLNSLGTWRIGPIVNSTPAISANTALNMKYITAYDDSTYRDLVNASNYRNRRSIAYVGSNIGMVHFFRVGHIRETGSSHYPVEIVNSPTDLGNNLIEGEELAFMPRNAIPYLAWYGREDYCSANRGYIPTIDQRVEVFDASFGPSGTATSNKTTSSWNTYLIGSMGFGGKAIGNYSSSLFLLRLTPYLNNPNTSPPFGNSAANVPNPPELMWEVKLDNGALTTSYPIRVRQCPRSGTACRSDQAQLEGHWFILTGSGPTDPTADDFGEYLPNPKLYIINARNGQVRRVNLDSLLPPNTRAAVGDIVVLDLNNDYNDDVIYFGMYGYTCSVAAVGNICPGTLRSWGGLYRIVLDETLSSINPGDITQVFDLSSFAQNNNIPPVFGSPTATLDEDGNLWVYFNTGIFLSPNHASFNYTNYLVGFKDKCWKKSDSKFDQCNNTHISTKNDLVDSTASSQFNDSNLWIQCSNDVLNITGVQTRNVCICNESGCARQPIIVSTTGPADPKQCKVSDQKSGWFYPLPSGHIAYSKPLVSFGIVLSAHFKPSDNVCLPIGETFTTSLHYHNGLPPRRPPLLMPGNVNTNSSGNPTTLAHSIRIGFGAPPIGEVFRFIRTESGEGRLIGQVSTGAVFNIRQQLDAHVGRFVLWIEK